MVKNTIKTVGELINHLQKYDQDMEIFTYNGEFFVGNRIEVNGISKTTVYDHPRYPDSVCMTEDWDKENDTSGKNPRPGLILGYETWS